MIALEPIVAIIKPTNRFISWLERPPICDSSLTISEHRKDCIAILIPYGEEKYLVDDYIKKIYPLIFKEELRARVLKQHWPKNLSFNLFQEWFDVEIHSKVFMTYDLLVKDYAK